MFSNKKYNSKAIPVGGDMMRDLFHNCVVGMLMGAFVRKKKIKIKGSPPPLFKETFFLSCFEPCML